MIVKNEEKVIRRCLDSLIGIADEIVIADTGSSDKTKEIALEYTQFIYDYQWENDFSKARNFVASKATGKWILAIDADEFVDRGSFQNFKNHFSDNQPKENILAVQIVNFIGTTGQNTVLNYHDRLYKNDGTIFYYRSIHEMLKHYEGKEFRGVSSLQLYHSGYMENVVREKDKSKRNLALLKGKKDKQPVDYYFLGNEYYQLREYDKAIRYYKKAYQLKPNIEYDWVLKLLVRLTNCLMSAKRKDEALQVIDASIEVFPFIADFLFLKGQLYYELDKTENAISIFESILIKKDDLRGDSSNDYLEYLPHKNLGELYEKKGDFKLAVQHYSSSLSINDSDNFVWIKLLSILGRHSTVDDLSSFVQNNCVNRKNMSGSRLIKILLNSSNLKVKKVSRILLEHRELSPLEKDGLILVNLLLDGEFEKLVNILNSSTLSQISTLLSVDIFTVKELILLALVTNSENLKKVLYDLNFDVSIRQLLDVLFYKKIKKLSELEEHVFLSLVELTNELEVEELAEILRKIKQSLRKKQL
jgi:glycosyltransferase involved in cell wall biosynthesis